MADAHKPDEKIVASHASRWSRLYEWLDSRTGIGSLLHEALDEPIPGGARWAYVFGSVLLFLFISQTVTGIFLSLYYAPTADHAHTTVAYIIKEVTGGSFLRSLHAYGSSAVVIVVLLHLSQTFLYGAYKGDLYVFAHVACSGKREKMLFSFASHTPRSVISARSGTARAGLTWVRDRSL